MITSQPHPTERLPTRARSATAYYLNAWIGNTAVTRLSGSNDSIGSGAPVGCGSPDRSRIGERSRLALACLSHKVSP